MEPVCDALTNGTDGQPFEPGVLYRPCGQNIHLILRTIPATQTDDLLQRVVVRQGTNIIYDSGIV